MAGRRGRRLGGRGVLAHGGGAVGSGGGRGTGDGGRGRKAPWRPPGAGGRCSRPGAGWGRAGRGRPGRRRVDPGRGQVVARYAYEHPRPPRCRRRAPGMAVRSCVEGGAGAPCGHRITGDPTRGCRGAPVGACARGPLARAMIATGLAQGDLGRPHRPPDRPVPADRVPRDPPWGGRGAGSTAPRRRRPRPGRPWPAPRSASRGVFNGLCKP